MNKSEPIDDLEGDDILPPPPEADSGEIAAPAFDDSLAAEPFGEAVKSVTQLVSDAKYGADLLHIIRVIKSLPDSSTQTLIS